MVVETTKFNPYDIVDYGLQIFIGLLVLMFLTWRFGIHLLAGDDSALSEIRKQGDVE